MGVEVTQSGRAFLALALSFFVSACATSAQLNSSTNCRAIFADQIITMDKSLPTVEAMIVVDGKISALGMRADLSADLMEPAQSCDKIDYGLATIIPGVVDSHVHVRELGMDKIKADLVGARTAKEITARVRSFYPDPKPGTWLIGQGWDEGAFASRGYPDRASLDAAFPDNPVYLESLHGFAAFVNSKALEIAGIDAETSDPQGGNILRRADGEPSGVLLTLAQGLVSNHVPPINQTDRQTAIKAGLLEMGRAGVTSVHEAGMTGEDVEAFKALQARGELPIRVYGLLDGNDEPLMESWFGRGPLDDPMDFLDIRGIKVFYDGSLGSRTALLQAPYSDEPERARPTERISPVAMQGLAYDAVRFGFQMAVHAIGDEGNNRTLGIYEQALGPDLKTDHRWRIEHAQVVLPDFYQRFAAIGGIASMQSSHAVGDSPWAEDRVGSARIKNAYAWRAFLEANIRLMINSDLPGEPWEPMQTLHFAVNRAPVTGGIGWYMEQALTPAEALRAMTIEGAYGAFQENVLGSLAPGKWADFVVLGENPLTADPDALAKIKVLQTWVAGKPLEF